ncbi:MAG: hypothetical protein ACM3H7_05380, partial [Acidobacteriaceae bacterium]
KGSLPDACHQLRVTMTQPDENNVINLEAYSVASQDAICTANLRPFEAPILLGSYASGHFIVYINGQMLGEFGIGYAPQPDDTSLARGEVFIDLENSQLLTSLARPIEVKALLRGSLPDPCHQLRVLVNALDSENRIDLEAYSLANPDAICITVVKPFDATISLGTYPSGHYRVYLNGELLGEFDG